VRIIGLILELYVLVLIVYSVLSWFRPGYDSPLRKVQQALALVCDPVLNLVRRIIPTARVGGVGIDLSVLVVVLVIEIILVPLFLG
jgi:YggT family protein